MLATWRISTFFDAREQFTGPHGAAQDSATVESHELWLNSAAYTPVRDDLIPTGALEATVGTPLDFHERRRVPIGAALAALGSGLDHNYVLNGPPADGPGAAQHDPRPSHALLLS